MRTHIFPARIFFLINALMFAASSSAQLSSFKEGPAIKGFGEHAPVPTHTVSEDTKFNIVFDVADGAEVGKVNRRFNSLARFINMHVAAGVKKENIHLALIVHGSAMFDLLNNESYKEMHSVDNPNEALLKALMDNKVRVILCGQSAAARGVEISQLVNGTEVELSAMTANALLQQSGYTINPS